LVATFLGGHNNFFKDRVRGGGLRESIAGKNARQQQTEDVKGKSRLSNRWPLG
jgi:hypothetical protein